MLTLLLKPRLAVSLVLVVTFFLPQVLTESVATEDHHTLEKRNVGVLARTGQLPYQQGKRYVASLARSGNLPVYLEKKLHPSVTSRNQHESQLEPDEKRYVGTLLRTGSLPFQFQNKRDSDQDGRDEEELERLKTLETVLYLESQLNLELLKEKLLEGVVREEDGDEKRSMASLARAGNMPLRGEEKRSVEALARAGYLPATAKTMAARNDNAEEVEASKRSVATLARNGQLRGFQEAGKRGGIGSLARNNLLPQKKDSDNIEELEELIEELIEEEKEKKNIGSVARSFSLPSYGKRNLGALARGGGYARYAKNGDEYQEEKRNLASLVRGRDASMTEGKRYLGSLARSQSIPLQKKDVDEEKRRAPMALARYWSKPINMDVFDKRFLPFDDMQSDPNVREIAKRYVAALLRQGRLPVGSDEVDEEHGDDKRHIGSVRNTAGISKRSIEHQPPDAHGKAAGGRSKREAYLSDEYPMPNVQNGELFDYDDLMEVMTGAAAPEKRFLGSVARSGWFRDSNRGQAGGVMGKRHIGALARLGWLPQLRSSRYRRFGRAMPSRVCKRSTLTDSREDPSDGSTTEDDASSHWTATSDAERRRLLDAATLRQEPLWKRYLLIPAVDNIFLRKLYSKQFIH